MTPPFLGTCPALITPFKQDGGIDFPAYEAHLKEQLAHSPGALLVAGTTGEGSALSAEEKKALIAFTRRIMEAQGQSLPILTGIASTATAHACRLAAEASEMGAELLLIIPPAYVRTSPAGLVAHFAAINQATALPILLYHVPSRTGQTLTLAHFEAVAQACPSVVGIKEASGSLSLFSALHSAFGDRFALYCGSDEINYPSLLLGGCGLISVLADLRPDLTAALCKAVATRALETALELHERSLPLVKALFAEPNPIPIKKRLAEKGLCRPECRIPLGELG